MKKSPRYFEWEITDAFTASDEWDSLQHDMLSEINAFDDPETFKQCRGQTFADTYLNHAEKIIREPAIQDVRALDLIKILRAEIGHYEKYCTFMQALELITLVNRTGEMPALSSRGKTHVVGSSQGGIRKKNIDDVRHGKWHADAEAIRAKHPTYTAWRIAGKLEESYRGNPRLHKSQRAIWNHIK